LLIRANKSEEVRRTNAEEIVNGFSSFIGYWTAKIYTFLI